MDIGAIWRLFVIERCLVVNQPAFTSTWNIYPSRCVDKYMRTHATAPETGITRDPPSLSPFPGIDEARKLAALAQALGDPVRLQILATLESVCLPVSTIVEATGLRQPAVSHHLRVLRDRGLVRGERRGTNIFYCLATDDVARAIEALHRLSASVGSAE